MTLGCFVERLIRTRGLPPWNGFIHMDANNTLHVRVERRGDKYIWALHRDGHFHPVRFSAPVYSSEETARVAGNEVRTDHLAHLARVPARGLARKVRSADE